MHIHVFNVGAGSDRECLGASGWRRGTGRFGGGHGCYACTQRKPQQYKRHDIQKRIVRMRSSFLWRIVAQDMGSMKRETFMRIRSTPIVPRAAPIKQVS